MCIYLVIGINLVWTMKFGDNKHLPQFSTQYTSTKDAIILILQDHVYVYIFDLYNP